MVTKLAFVFAFLLLACFPAKAQKISRGPNPPMPESGPVSVHICVRDARGIPVEFPVIVRLSSTAFNYDTTRSTQETSTAIFPRVDPGEYQVEIHAQGYKDTSESINVIGFGNDFYAYIYLQSEGSTATGSVAPQGVVMTPKLQAEIEKGLAAMRKQQYEAARVHFAKCSQIAPGNPDVLYLLGTAELGLQHSEQARIQFENALKLEPSNEKALLALGEIQLRAGELSSAIVTLEKAFDVNGADWRTHFLLARAYAKSGRLAEAEKHAARAATLAGGKGANAFYTLGEIQFAEQKTGEARETWQRLLIQFPTDPIVPRTKERLAAMGLQASHKNDVNVVNLPLAVAPDVDLGPVIERPWAPPDIDSIEYRLAGNAACNVDEVLARAVRRLKSQLKNFEKFTATERIEHQEVDRYGTPGSIKSREFSYIVFVQPLQNESVFLKEDRLGGNDLSTFPTSLATTGLNSMGVAVLQAYPAGGLSYQCEGLGTLRGQATWQIRFEELDGSNAPVRVWRKNGQTVELPLKGRLWLTATSFDLLRIETDLTKPIQKLDLTRDHLMVDYGPVNFESGHTQLWLPWSAEMFMELHGKRYHHKHYLRDYYLFAVDSNHKIAAPKSAPAATAELAP